MDGLTEEETAIVALVAEFVDREVRPVAQELDHTNTYPEKLIDQMKQMGIFGMAVPEPWGETQVSAQCYAAVTEERRCPIARVGDLELNLADSSVCRGDRPIELSSRELTLLKVFMREPGRVFGRTELRGGARSAAQAPTAPLVTLTWGWRRAVGADGLRGTSRKSGGAVRRGARGTTVDGLARGR